MHHTWILLGCEMQVARASAAAPTFFPAAVIDPIYRTSPAEESESGESDYFVDGGIIANNPTMQALTMAFTEVRYIIFVKCVLAPVPLYVTHILGKVHSFHCAPICKDVATFLSQ